MSGDEAEDMDEDLARAIELSMQEGDEGEGSMSGAEAASGDGDSTDEPAPKKQAPDEVQRAIDTVATASRGAPTAAGRPGHRAGHVLPGLERAGGRVLGVRRGGRRDGVMESQARFAIRLVF